MQNQTRGRARIGVLVPFTNTNLEPDMGLLRPPGVSVHVARLGGYDIDAIPDAGQMAGLGMSDIGEPLRLLSAARPDVILYGCTSATLTHGPGFDRALAERVRQQSGAATVTAAGALIHALNALGVRRIGFASPYVPEINDRAVAFLSGEGFQIVARADVTDTLDNYGQGALAPDDVAALGARAHHADADAVVLSCTDMRSVEAIDRLETAIGKPVVTSNQAMMFQAMQLLQLTDIPAGYGILFTRLADRAPDSVTSAAPAEADNGRMRP